MERRQKAVARSFLGTLSLDGKTVERQEKVPDGIIFTLSVSGGQENSDEASPLDRRPVGMSTEIHSEVRLRSRGRVHFIKNLKQHDTRKGRDHQSESEHQSSFSRSIKDTSKGLDAAAEEVKGKTVSYTKLLSQTKARGESSIFARQCGSHSPLSPSYNVLFNAGVRRGFNWNSIEDYDPNLLDNSQWHCGKHKRVLVFQSYMTTLIEFVKPLDLKKDMNESFHQKFPRVQLTLSKIRSLKREIWKLAQEDCGYEELTVAMAFVYFEKLALRGKVGKLNRKLCAGACVLLAAKISRDLSKPEVKRLIDAVNVDQRLEERLRVNRRDLLSLEFPVLVALEFNLHPPQREILPHHRHLQLVQTS